MNDKLAIGELLASMLFAVMLFYMSSNAVIVYSLGIISGGITVIGLDVIRDYIKLKKRERDRKNPKKFAKVLWEEYHEMMRELEP